MEYYSKISIYNQIEIMNLNYVILLKKTFLFIIKLNLDYGILFKKTFLFIIKLNYNEFQLWNII